MQSPWTNGRERAQSSARRLVAILLRAGLLLLTLILGFVFGAANYPVAMDLAATLQLSFLQLRNKSASGNWFPARFKHSGVRLYDAARTQPGYTLYTLAPDLSAHLIDMNGLELHRWSLSRNEVMPRAAMEARTLFGAFEPQVETGHLFPNGDLLLIYEQKAVGASDTLLVKLDMNSHILWKTQAKVHHAVEVAGDKIYALTSKTTPPTADIPSLAGMPVINESLSILAADGVALSTHSILDAMANAKGMRLIDTIPFSDRIDPLHSNSLDVLTEQTAHFVPGAKPGDVLLSLRNLDMLVVLDTETDTIVWALRGGWRRQHDAKMLPNGHILLFDNQGDLTGSGRSRVLEILPATGAIVWSFSGTDDDPLDSEIRGGAQRIAGGNTLISESTSGRILEVTPNGSIAWEYVDPLVAVENGQSLVASLGLTVTRYDPSYVSFLDDKHRLQAAR